jgi:HPr kinase/phosphorylase
MEIVNIHASCIILRGAGAAFGAPGECGVLLLGESGAGKSDLALRLIAQGALLVTDDRTELFVHSNILCARPPKTIAGLIEVRGIGIMSLPFEKAAVVGLVVQLVPRKLVPRMPAHEEFDPPPKLEVKKKPPLVRISAFDPSAPAKIAVAAAAFANALFREENKPS